MKRQPLWEQLSKPPTPLCCGVVWCGVVWCGVVCCLPQACCMSEGRGPGQLPAATWHEASPPLKIMWSGSPLSAACE